MGRNWICYGDDMTTAGVIAPGMGRATEPESEEINDEDDCIDAIDDIDADTG